MKRGTKMRLKMMALLAYEGACENASSNMSEMEECVDTLRDNLTPNDFNYLSACDGVANLDELYQCVGIEEDR